MIVGVSLRPDAIVYSMAIRASGLRLSRAKFSSFFVNGFPARLGKASVLNGRWPLTFAMKCSGQLMINPFKAHGCPWSNIQVRNAQKGSCRNLYVRGIEYKTMESDRVNCLKR